MYVGLKQPRGYGERCVIPVRAAAKETTYGAILSCVYSNISCGSERHLIAKLYTGDEDGIYGVL